MLHHNERYSTVDLLEPWDNRPIGERIVLVQWLACSLIKRGIAWPSFPNEW
jgi:hypothetical protein